MSDGFKRYYEDELAFLREMGGEFARAYPNIASGLGLGAHDPDVERLLQGVAFLCGRIRQTLDEEFPDLLNPLLGHIWPQALRPSPCCVILEFTPRPNMFREPELLDGGYKEHCCLVQSKPVEGTSTSCQFRLAYDTPILPLRVEDVQLTAPSPPHYRLTVVLGLLPGACPARLGKAKNRKGEQVDVPLRLFLHGANIPGLGREAYGLFAALSHSLRAIRLRVLGANGTVLGEPSLPIGALRAGGWDRNQTLLPYPHYSFTGYRHLAEYFLFSPKHLFFDLDWKSALAGFSAAERIEVLFDLDLPPGERLTPSKDHVRVNCVPAVNLFHHTATPYQADGTRAEYLLRPEGSSPEFYDIFSVERVTGHVQRTAHPVEYLPFFSFHRARNAEHQVLYQIHLRPPVSNRTAVRDNLPAYPAVPMFLSFVESSGNPLPVAARISADLLCTNRDLPLMLREGDVCKPTRDIPTSLQFHDLGPISAPAPAPVARAGLWRFFAHLMTGLHHFRDRNSLRLLLSLYHLPAHFNKEAATKRDTLLDAIASVSARPGDRPFGRPPTLMRGTEVHLSVHESQFAHFGELLLFGAAIDRFLMESSAANTYTRLTLHGMDQKQEHAWPARVGTQELV